MGAPSKSRQNVLYTLIFKYYINFLTFCKTDAKMNNLKTLFLDLLGPPISESPGTLITLFGPVPNPDSRVPF